jgi:hypothetical protein
MSIYSKDSLEASTHAKATIASGDDGQSLTSGYSNRVSLALSDLGNDSHQISLVQSFHTPQISSRSFDPRSQRLSFENRSQNSSSIRGAGDQPSFSSAFHSLSPAQKLINHANNISTNTTFHKSIDMNTIAQFSTFQSNEKLDYKKELQKLLNKSKGTPYEQSLKRFVEKKLREINKDQDDSQHNYLSSLTGNEGTNHREVKHSNHSPFEKSGRFDTNKFSLMDLSSSKYDSSPTRKGVSMSPNRSGAAPFLPSSTDRYDLLNKSSDTIITEATRELSRGRLEELSRPLERNKYTVSLSVYFFPLSIYRSFFLAPFVGSNRLSCNNKSYRPATSTTKWC